MRFSKSTKLAAIAAVSTLAVAASAPAIANEDNGNTSLAAVLDISNQAFDSDNTDFDILTAAINAVLEAKPDSAVSVLADGDTAVTAFIPTDGAFRKLVWQLGEHDWRTISEQAVFTAVAGLGIDAVETVLLHHVVVGPAIDLKTAVGADGAALESAAGQDLNVEVGTSLRIDGSYGGFWSARVSLARTDINEGNNQLAHVINNVLVPDLG
jgi:uncharacterized surface protein with fasciclin (FAS1) repeats